MVKRIVILATLNRYMVFQRGWVGQRIYTERVGSSNLSSPTIFFVGGDLQRGSPINRKIGGYDWD